MSLKLGPRYRVLGPIGSGGMGSVLLALRRDGVDSSTPVAIKQLHAHLEHDPEMVAMFLDEARIASRITHENVVHVDDVEMIGEHVVIVMPYIEGVSLSTLLAALKRENKTLPVPLARRILRDVSCGLHAAHELIGTDGAPLGLVHRDVSPHNILVGVDGVARVADFGVAIASGRLASTRTGGGVKGKLQYLSPEQVNRKKVDRRADIFSAGSVLWECLTGRRLFSGETEAETLAMILREPIDPPSSVNLEVPLELDEVCLKALERDPVRRYATAEELAVAIDEGKVASRREVGALVEEWAEEELERPRGLLIEAFGRGLEEGTETTRRPVIVRAAPNSSRPWLAPGMLVAGLLIGGAIVFVSTSKSTPPPIVAPSAEARPVEASAAASVAPQTTESFEVASDPPPVAAPKSGARPRPGSRKPTRSADGGKPWMPSDL